MLISRKNLAHSIKICGNLLQIFFLKKNWLHFYHDSIFQFCHPYLTPNPCQYWASINAIPHHCWSETDSCHFSSFQTCVQSDFTLVKFGPSAKIRFCTGIEMTFSLSLKYCSSSPATVTVEGVSFAPSKYANFKGESEQNILHERFAFTIAQFWFILGVRYRQKLSHILAAAWKIFSFSFLCSFWSENKT